MAHPEWIAPRSDRRVFLGEPGAPEATKTTVEPGNSFSPGMGTFGITWWLRFPATGLFFAPETAPLERLHWRYEHPGVPPLHCEVEVGGLAVRHSLCQDGSARDRSEAVCGRLRLTNTGERVVDVQLFLALRSLGPAGGPIDDLCVGEDDCSFWRARLRVPLLGVDRRPTAIGCGVGDPSPLALMGEVPAPRQVEDAAGWCFGLMRFEVSLAPGASWQVHFDCPLQTRGPLQAVLPGTASLRPAQYAARASAVQAEWSRQLGHLEIAVPDPRFGAAFFAGLHHMLTTMVGDQARIAPLAYPLPWLRDSVYIIRCLDLAGLHATARAATEICTRHDFFGGFGPEGDAPGQGIWALVQHYRITRDRAWLERIYPAIRRKCEWLFRMRRATEPMQVVGDTPVLAFVHAERTAGVICVAAQDGLIQGVMDHGVDHAVGWVNHWALCGLREAAHAAQELGFIADACAYAAEATVLWTALHRLAFTHPAFFQAERTVASLLWPTRAWEEDPTTALAGFNAWWERRHGRSDGYQPEPYWLYFEFAQAHQALILGQRERAWRIIEHRLAYPDLPGLYGWREGGEGVGTRNAVCGGTLLPLLRGCQRFESVTPHGWAQAEMWLLQRAVLVEEWRDGLLFFAGVPAHWIAPGALIAFRRFPTHYGTVSGELAVVASGRAAHVTLTGAAPGTPVRIALPGRPVIERPSVGEELSFVITL